ncbi:hypothetical protein Tco_1040863, partial [Tanacetum coccineum]
DADNEMFDVDTLNDDEVSAEQEVAAKDVNLTINEVTLAQALAALKSVKPKVSAATTTTATILTPRKGIVIIELEAAKKLQAEFDEEERLTREKDEANVSLTEEWDDIQAKIEVDHELAQRLQAEEQEELWKLIEPEPVKPTKKKVQIMLDEEIALKLQAKINEEDRIARSKEEKINEANIVWDEIQAKVNADYQLAERLQAEEQEQFTI